MTAIDVHERNDSYPLVRRGYVDIEAGQVHYRAAGSDAPGRRPLICFHQSPSSSLTYQEILPLLGERRRVVAMDTPGFGESFRPRRKPDVPAYATWLHQAIKALGYQHFDIMGMFTGAGIACEMAMRFPDEVVRVVLVGPPYFDAEHRNKDIWPELPRLDGSHLLVEWNKMMATLPFSGVTFARQFETFRELWRGGANAVWGEEAITDYPLKETLPQVRQPVLVVHPDGLRANVPAAAAALADARVARLEGLRGYFMMQTHPDVVAGVVTPFLDEA